MVKMSFKYFCIFLIKTRDKLNQISNLYDCFFGLTQSFEIARTISNYDCVRDRKLNLRKFYQTWIYLLNSLYCEQLALNDVERIKKMAENDMNNEYSNDDTITENSVISEKEEDEESDESEKKLERMKFRQKAKNESPLKKNGSQKHIPTDQQSKKFAFNFPSTTRESQQEKLSSL